MVNKMYLTTLSYFFSKKINTGYLPVISYGKPIVLKVSWWPYVVKFSLPLRYYSMLQVLYYIVPLFSNKYIVLIYSYFTMVVTW